MLATEATTNTTVRLAGADGFPLEGSLTRPAGAPRGLVVVASATGVPRRYYAAFARALAGAGLATLTFDYRGVGGSRPRRLRGFACAMHEWGELDLAGALDWLADRFPGRPLLVVGHSVGGQVLGMARPLERVAAVLTVASQSGYWRLWTGLRGAQMALYWHLLIPAAVRAAGYLPMSLVGGEDLPAGVARQWAAWGRDPRYLLPTVEARGHSGYARFDRPWRALAFSDDAYAPVAAVERLLGYYPRARSELRVIAPADVGARAIGHFGFFRPAFEATLWREAIDWLVARAAGEEQQQPARR